LADRIGKKISIVSKGAIFGKCQSAQIAH
jgi:hypothetical protein